MNVLSSAIGTLFQLAIDHCVGFTCSLAFRIEVQLRKYAPATTIVKVLHKSASRRLGLMSKTSGAQGAVLCRSLKQIVSELSYNFKWPLDSLAFSGHRVIERPNRSRRISCPPPSPPLRRALVIAVLLNPRLDLSFHTRLVEVTTTVWPPTELGRGKKPAP